jgi:hypothetical protein
MKRSWLFLLALLPVATQAQTPDSGSFVVKLGHDTIALERYSRTPTQLWVKAVIRVPETRIIDLNVDWDASGRLRGYQMRNSAPPRTGGAAAVRTIATVVGDSVQFEVAMGNGLPRIRVVPAGGDVPLIGYLYSPHETAILRARASQPATLTMLTSNGPIVYAARWSRDSVWLTQADSNVIRVALDANGRLAGLSGAETTFQVEVTPTEVLDIATIAAHWPPLGTLSPRDTANLNVSGAKIMIDYGRPAARGRRIYGGVVPWDRVWRTGANAATQFSTTRTLEIGGVMVPPGKYSLWTIPGRGKPWELIINRQSGQWGTVYDPREDLARIPIRTETLSSRVERFTIDLHARDRGGVISLTWDRTRMLVPFTVRS